MLLLCSSSFLAQSTCIDPDDEVDYSSDSQKGNSVGSPFSLQLAFSSPLSSDKDLSACVALLRNSPVKARTESPLSLTEGDESLQEEGSVEADKVERLGASHVQGNEENPERELPLKQDGIVLFLILLLFRQPLQETKRKKIISQSGKLPA
jgi:hypothetical protein